MPKIVDHDAYREELIQKYFDHFAKRGYADVTMREIARELDVSTGTLYHYFPSKKSILEHMLKLASRHDMSEAIEHIDENTPAEERIKAFCDYIMEKEDWYQDIVLLTIDYYRHYGLENTFELMKEADHYYGNGIAEVVGIEPKYGFLIAIFFNGLIYHRLVFPDSVSFEEQSELFQKMVMSYLREAGIK
ncbi:MAG: TetR/AcrR family transcriptional regulator [Bacillota bacterium]|nr:TetR/AcrR family transcriptional regulator [Bacillota bacterium]